MNSSASSDYLADYACMIGRLIGNLLSLELCLRIVLYEMKQSPHTDLPSGLVLTSVIEGDRLPLNALTSWDTLGQLIEKYNMMHESRLDLQIDVELKTLRDAFAHGRILAGDPPTHLTLVRLAKPQRSSVTVEMVQPLPVDWVNDQAHRVGDAIQSVYIRLRELRSQPRR